MQTTERRLLRVPEAAKMLGISPAHLWRVIQAGRIPVLRIGRSTRIDVRDLEAFIANNKTGAA